MIKQHFGARAWPHWLALREFVEEQTRAKKGRRPIHLTASQRSRLRAALAYLRAQRRQRWTHEIAPWARAIRQSLDGVIRTTAI
jgi:hypothetical protein